MTTPINIRSGWIQVTVSPQKAFDKPETFQEITDPEELLSCWDRVKHIVDRIVEEQINRSRLVTQHNAKLRTVIDIHNALLVNEKVDDNLLLSEVLKTGNYSEDEAKLLIKKVRDEKLEGGMAWY